MKNILIVASHPDDEVLGCGGTVAKFAASGAEVSALFLGDGVTAREGSGKDAIEKRKNEAKKASEIIGVRNLFFYEFPDNRFDTSPFIEIVKTIELVKKEVKPDAIFTHFEGDLNIDHSITHKAVLTATRPMPHETVKEIYSFEVLSSTEWNFRSTFKPDFFVNIEETLDRKIEALNCYKDELREWPHPRSIEGAKNNAQNWGMKVGVPAAEAFKTVRRII